MIYLVTKQQELFSNPSYKIITVEESLELLEPLEIVGLDTETEGLEVYTKKLKSIQLGCFDFQIVIDTLTISPSNYKEYLESDRLFIGWNLKFDLKFLYHQGIVPKRVWDGYLAEKLLWQGYPPGVHSMSLKTAGETYLGIELDKSVRGKIIWAGLTTDVIVYSANDVKYLEQIMDKQKEALKNKGLLKAIDYENSFVIPLAYCEYCGVKLDINKWREKMHKDAERASAALNACNKWVTDFYEAHKSSRDFYIEEDFVFEREVEEGAWKDFTPTGKYEIIGPPKYCTALDESHYVTKRIKLHFPYITINYEGDLFEGYDTSPKCCINWNSAKQLIPFFKMFGIDVKVDDREKGGKKDSIDAKTLKPQKDKCSLIPLYLEYKEAVKVTSTYGENFLDQINPISGRIHTNFNQLGTDTGRLSSGGKDKSTKTSYVNLQNLPADAETRECFVAEPHNRWISIDYSGEESFLMASIANDKAMLNELINGDKDLHTLTAKIVFSDIIPFDTPTAVVKDKYKKYRKAAKGYEFAFNYNGNADTIKRNFGLTSEEADRIYNAYMSGFNGLKKYQEFKHKDWQEKGYILISTITGHKAFIYDYVEMQADKKWMKELDWEYYREMKKECPTSDTVQRVKHFFKRKSAVDKQSSNYEIQGTGALIFKLASVYFFNWLRKNNLLFKVKLCIPVHDEWNIEAPEEIAEEVAQKLYNSMVKAGSFFCTRCKLDADISRLEDGTLPTYWIH